MVCKIRVIWLMQICTRIVFYGLQKPQKRLDQSLFCIHAEKWLNLRHFKTECFIFKVELENKNILECAYLRKKLKVNKSFDS